MAYARQSFSRLVTSIHRSVYGALGIKPLLFVWVLFSVNQIRLTHIAYVARFVCGLCNASDAGTHSLVEQLRMSKNSVTMDNSSLAPSYVCKQAYNQTTIPIPQFQFINLCSRSRTEIWYKGKATIWNYQIFWQKRFFFLSSLS